MEPKTRTEIRNIIQNRLANSYDFVALTLTAVLGRQTLKEAEQRDSIYRNRLGFSKRDAQVYTTLAEKVISGQGLSGIELDFLRWTNKNGRMRLAQYAVQVYEILGENQMSLSF